MRPTRVLFSMLLLLQSGLALAADAHIMAVQAWSRATPPGVPVGAAYLQLHNHGSGADRLLAASSPVAERVEIHATLMEQGVMKMRAQDSVEVAGGASVSFEPGGMHLMLLDLRHPLAQGSRFPVQLQFEKSGLVRVDVEVREIGSGGDVDHSAHAGMDHSAMDHSGHAMGSDAGNGMAMKLHHMHMLANHAVEMAAAAASLNMIGQMAMAPGIDESASRHGDAMIAEARSLLEDLLQGEAMQAMHAQGATPEADAEMNYTHGVIHGAQGVVEVLANMPASPAHGVPNSAAAMTMHHMHVMIGHALQMASEGSTMLMLSQMNMAPDVDVHGAAHGRQMLADARQMVAQMMTGPAMMKLHQQGSDPAASQLMAYTHELGRVAMAQIDLLARMSPAGPEPAQSGAHHQGGGHHGGMHGGMHHGQHHGGGQQKREMKQQHGGHQHH